MASALMDRQALGTISPMFATAIFRDGSESARRSETNRDVKALFRWGTDRGIAVENWHIFFIVSLRESLGGNQQQYAIGCRAQCSRADRRDRSRRGVKSRQAVLLRRAPQ